MSPIRLIIIGILLYIGYLLIVGGRKKKSDDSENGGTPHVSDDVLMECPECEKLVPKGQAKTLNHEGETLYFCSDECCETFVSEKGAR